MKNFQNYVTIVDITLEKEMNWSILEGRNMVSSITTVQNVYQYIVTRMVCQVVMFTYLEEKSQVNHGKIQVPQTKSTFLQTENNVQEVEPAVLEVKLTVLQAENNVLEDKPTVQEVESTVLQTENNVLEVQPTVLEVEQTVLQAENNILEDKPKVQEVVFTILLFKYTILEAEFQVPLGANKVRCPDRREMTNKVKKYRTVPDLLFRIPGQDMCHMFSLANPADREMTIELELVYQREKQ
jgi:hypothetical protein